MESNQAVSIPRSQTDSDIDLSRQSLKVRLNLLSFLRHFVLFCGPFSSTWSTGFIDPITEFQIWRLQDESLKATCLLVKLLSLNTVVMLFGGLKISSRSLRRGAFRIRPKMLDNTLHKIAVNFCKGLREFKLAPRRCRVNSNICQRDKATNLAVQLGSPLS